MRGAVPVSLLQSKKLELADELMFKVKTLQETQALIHDKFGALRVQTEIVPLGQALNRFLASAAVSAEFVPDFDRATVDGFAVHSRDTLGCSESIPALLRKTGESFMGKAPDVSVSAGQCVYISTGAALPAGADAVVMLEHTEALAEDLYAFYKPTPAGANIIRKGEDSAPGQVVIPSGKRLHSADLGTLAAMGLTQISISTQPRVAIISTGDELVTPEAAPGPAQIRDVNGPLLQAMILEAGGSPRFWGIIPDQAGLLEETMSAALKEADVLLVSGGTSVGTRDQLPEIITRLGDLWVHGIAVKPGKPTIVGAIQGKPVFGLPGNPAAAYFMFRTLVRPLLAALQGGTLPEIQISARLDRAVSSNHGREEFILVSLSPEGLALPLLSKSGLISMISRADGFIVIARDEEGLPAGASVWVTRL